MNATLIECQVHPLVPGALLAAIIAATNPEDPRELLSGELLHFSRMAPGDVVAHFVGLQRLTSTEAERLNSVEQRFTAAFETLRKRIPDLATVTSCKAADILQLARALYSARLISEQLEVVAAPQSSFERTADGTVDLLEALGANFSEYVGGLWSFFFMRENFSLAADASAQFWVACLHNHAPEEMTKAFIGLFHLDQKERFQMLNKGYSPDRRIHIRDIITEYLDNSRDRFLKLHETVDRLFKKGLDRIFQDLARTIKKLGLPNLMILYYEALTREVGSAFSVMDGEVSSREARFSEYLRQQIAIVVQECLNSPISMQGNSTEALDSLMRELDEMVGIDEVKAKVKEVANLAWIQQLRVAQGLKRIPTSYHSVYVGNPGTGKTMVARLMGRIYRSLGVLKRGHLVECDRSALVAEYVGQTAIRTNSVIDSAIDGILFIDEAYSLAKDQNDFGREAIETLLKRMEDNRDRLIVIVAGYPNEMEGFIHSNPGLESRFTRFVEFPDYTPWELSRIFGLMCRKNGLRIAPALKEAVIHHFNSLHEKRDQNFGNARLVRNCFESVINTQATRLASQTRIDVEALTMLEETDLQSEAHKIAEEYRKHGGAYDVKCLACGQVYTWLPSQDLHEAQCTNCNAVYDGEFGYLEEPLDITPPQAAEE